MLEAIAAATADNQLLEERLGLEGDALAEPDIQVFEGNGTPMRVLGGSESFRIQCGMVGNADPRHIGVELVLVEALHCGYIHL